MHLKRAKSIVKSIEMFWPDLQAAIWKAKCQDNPLLDCQNHESGQCSCKCSPIPIDHLLRYTIKNKHSCNRGTGPIKAFTNEAHFRFGNSDPKCDLELDFGEI